MNVHVPSGRWRLGLLLALFTAVLWGSLPVALKVVLGGMDPYTATWCRFLASALVMSVYVVRKHGPPRANRLKGGIPALMALAVFGLCGNYILYAVGLDYLTPSVNAVVIQLAPMLFLIGGLAVFKERFVLRQYAGIAVLAVGLGLFFNQRWDELIASFGDYTIGVIVVICSAVSWALYALAQKQLLKTYPSETIMAVIYIGAAVLFAPLARPASIYKLDGVEFALLAFCALNTIVAYGCFSEALDHLEASRVSAVIVTVPLITMAAMKILTPAAPDYIRPEGLNALSVAGAFLVVSGSILAVLSGKRQPPAPE